MLTDQTAHPRTFGSHDNRQRPAQVRFVKRSTPVHVESRDPRACTFECVERPHEIGYLRYPQVLSRACGGPHHGRRNPDRASCGDDDASKAHGESRPQQCSEVLRILKGIQRQHQCLIASSPHGIKERGERGVVERAHLGSDTLMARVNRIEARARHAGHADLAPLGLGENDVERAVALPGSRINENSIDPLIGPQGF